MAIKISDCTISCGKPDEYGVYDINNFSIEYNPILCVSSSFSCSFNSFKGNFKKVPILNFFFH